MEFIKRVLIWATIWTGLVMAYLVYNDIQAGTALDVPGSLLVTVIVWVVMAGVVTMSKIMSAARNVGRNIGRAVVSNPRQDAVSAVGSAVDDALQNAGVTQRPPASRG